MQLEQTLPVLNSFNNSFDFISVGSLTSATGTSGTGANFSSNFGTSFSGNMGANLGASLGVTTLNTQSGSSLSSLNGFGLPPGLGVAPITSQTLRALLVLESDMQRMLPMLGMLTGETNSATGIGLTPGFTPGAITNVFIVPAVVR
jgi:hypothetical protein